MSVLGTDHTANKTRWYQGETEVIKSQVNLIHCSRLMPPVPERTGEKQSSEADMGSVECPTTGKTWKDRAPTPGCKRHICTYLYHRLLAEGTLSYACKVSRRWTITWSASQPPTGLIGWLLGIYVLMSAQADRGDHPSECNLPSLNFFMWALF